MIGFWGGILISYLLGSLPSGYLVGKWVAGVDIRREGSGNVGATNVFRVVGKGWGVGVFLFDLVKGLLAVTLIARWIPATFDLFFISLACGLATIVGHTWTIWLGFKGGKGVATSAGVFLGLAPLAAGTALLIWILLFIWKRYVSLASLGTAVIFPLLVFGFYRGEEFFVYLFPVSLTLAVFIGYTHRDNIQRLRKGEEKRLI